MFFLSAGGSLRDRAKPNPPSDNKPTALDRTATDAAYIIEARGAAWGQGSLVRLVVRGGGTSAGSGQARGRAWEGSGHHAQAPPHRSFVPLPARPQLTDQRAQWKTVGPMPHKRLMGDAVTLCDGTVAILGGAEAGLAQWSDKKASYRFKDGSTWKCGKMCSDAWPPVYEPVRA